MFRYPEHRIRLRWDPPLERLSMAGSLRAGTGVGRFMNSILGEIKDENGGERGKERQWSTVAVEILLKKHNHWS